MSVDVRAVVGDTHTALPPGAGICCHPAIAVFDAARISSEPWLYRNVLASSPMITPMITIDRPFMIPLLRNCELKIAGLCSYWRGGGRGARGGESIASEWRCDAWTNASSASNGAGNVAVCGAAANQPLEKVFSAFAESRTS